MTPQHMTPTPEHPHTCYICSEPAAPGEPRCAACAGLSEIQVAGLIAHRWHHAKVQMLILDAGAQQAARVLFAGAPIEPWQADSGMKRCTCCGEVRPGEKFDPKAGAEDATQCRPCSYVKKVRRKWVATAMAEVALAGAGPALAKRAEARLKTLAVDKFPLPGPYEALQLEGETHEQVAETDRKRLKHNEYQRRFNAKRRAAKNKSRIDTIGATREAGFAPPAGGFATDPELQDKLAGLLAGVAA